MSTPFFQPLDPQAAPVPVTPADGPGDAAGYAMVSPHGQGTAPYDIAAPLDTDAITAVCDAAGAVSGAGIVYPQGTRQHATEVLLNSPAGFSAGGGISGYDIPQGWTGEPDESFVNNAQPTSILETPVQGTMDYPVDNTYQPGLQMYGTD